jgi:hypothetical protein
MDTHGKDKHRSSRTSAKSRGNFSEKYNKTILSKFKPRNCRRVHRLGDLIARYKKGTVASTGNEYIEFFLRMRSDVFWTG